jgi:hypothetical protein
MKPLPGIYEVYTSKSVIEAVTSFREKYGYLPDEVQRVEYNALESYVLAGPVKQIGYHDVEQFYKDNDKEIEPGEVKYGIS